MDFGSNWSVVIFEWRPKCHNAIHLNKASGYTVYLLVNSIFKIVVHLHMSSSQLEDQQVATPTQPEITFCGKMTKPG